MSETVFDAFVSGKAAAKIYDHNGHATIIGRYQVVKVWVVEATEKRKQHTRRSISYRHQKPAAIRLAERFLVKFGKMEVRK